MTQTEDHSIPLRHRLTFRLTAGVILSLLLIGCPFLLAFHRMARERQLQTLSDASTGLSRVLIEGLQTSMLSGQPHLFDESFRRLAGQDSVERVVLLDHDGRVRISSDQSEEGDTLRQRRDATCAVCHAGDGATSGKPTAVTRLGGRKIFRAMSVIRNEPRCHGCHDPDRAMNGILLIDLALGPADRRFLAGIGGTVALGVVMVLVTIGALALLLRRMVHSPLAAIVSTSRKIVQGDLGARVPVSSPGELGQLASRVNRMTDHLSESLSNIEHQRADLESILDAVDDEIVVLDREQRIVAANRAFRKGLGDAIGPIEGRACSEVSATRWPCAADGPDGCPVESVFRTGKLHKGITSRNSPDGREQVIEIHASPLRGPDGEITRAVEVRRDISERRHLEAGLAHSERLASLGLLASGLSHEINNPLGAISTSVDGLRRRLVGTDAVPVETARDLDTALSMIAQEVRRCRTITNRLLRIARPSGTSRAVVDVNHVVTDVCALLADDMRRSGIRASLVLAEKLPPFVGDESMVGQVVMNLAMNATQAMAGSGGRLRIATSRLDGSIQIEVEDTGRGIPPELKRRVFEPFFTTKPVGKGTGLGLFITHRIVTGFGGTIDLRSEPGRGTCLTVRLPAGGLRP